ncbi:DUF1444 family protein, partial [Staphylococcus aureus]|uniref:DUF1444 family protein n=1 Tax=Staphylococcus aureus TaxID=1280 RepID=UPI00119E1435
QTIPQIPHKTLHTISSSQIMPLITPTTFHKKTKQGLPFIYHHHTPQTAVYYPLHLPKSYPLIHQTMLHHFNLTQQQITQISLFNLTKFSNSYTTHQLKPNIFYFINSNHPYHPTTILNTPFLN